MKEIDPSAAIKYIYENRTAYASACSEVTYIEQFLKSKRAILMKEALADGHANVNAQEREALAHPDYVALLDGLKEAVKAKEELRWGIVAAEASIEVWRSTEATNRMMDRAVM
jgi:hypothetical protein